MTDAGSDLAAQVGDLRRRLQAVEAELEQLKATPTGDGGPRFAAIYDEFTDRFRGSTADVTAKLQGYLPDVRRLVRAGDTAGTGGVVDVGCGRGEWLTLLREAGVRARGVDSNQAFVTAAGECGLAVELGDAVGFLRGLGAGSVDMVTCFHVVEHLDTEELLALLEAAYGTLRSGGCLLLETPNPQNIVMASCDFYNDPTHRQPLPPALTEYLVCSQGFVDIEVRALHPKSLPALTSGAVALPEVLQQLLFGPQDYAVLGYKPATNQ